MNSAPIVDRIRIIPRPTDFLDRNVGSSGEVFFNKNTNSLRVYSGKDSGGFELAKADLSNIPSTGIDLPSVQKNKIRFHWDTLADLQAEVDPTTYHGMIAHVHSEGRLYFAHAGAWIAVANQSEIGGSIPTDISELTDTTNLLDHFSGSYTDLTNKPTIPTVLTDLSISDGTTGQILSTDGAGNFTFIDAPQSGSTQNLFATIQSDDGSTTASSPTEILDIIGGTNISTRIGTDTVDLEINMEPFEIGFLSNVSNAAATTGQVLKWDGSQWAPGTDITSGGSGLDADTLDGFEGTYYLNYNNFTNTPTVVTLTDLSVGNELAASGDGAISYDNTTGVFRYTPPDLSSYLTSVAFNDLTSTPTTLAGYGITDSPTDITDLGIIDGTNGQVLTTDGAGNFTFTSVSAGGSGATNFLELNDTPSSFGTAGQVVAVNSGADGLEFSTLTTGDANQNAFSIVAVSGQTDVTADTTTDTLTLAAGTDISLTTSGNTVTITSTASGGSTTFSGLTDVSTASISIDKIYEPAIAMLRVDNVGTSAYTFDSHYSGNNPTIFVLAGTTIAFDLDNIGGHPFEIQDPTSTPYNTGLVHVSSSGTVSTGSSAQGKTSGTLYWRIPESISGGYRYQCQSHIAMVGAITVKRLSAI